MNINLNDKIRSYDFEPIEGREPCFVEGIVTEIQSGFVHFRVTRDHWAGKDQTGDTSRVGSITSCPLPDSNAIFFPSDWEGRLTVIKEGTVAA